jgi:lipopolysaccharide transport system ATP-binding protein
MSKPIIEVEHLSKCYRIGAMREPYLSLREELAKKTRRISSAFSRAFGKGQAGPSGSETDFWALNDVNFSVQEGEAVGIIGRNGAGKSTLLKILSQITPPTKGQITMRGRVASLLEVGTGFHPELTGRENIFLNGAILGMRRDEIRRKFDEIVAFAEIEKFLDTPVKRYSSGMYVRLAFAVAAHLEPEILIVDEVLAVGDAQFQKKCLGKMSDISKGGRTVLFVSHNMTAVTRLCNQAFLLSDGRIIKSGSSQDIVQAYLKEIDRGENGRISINSTQAIGDCKVRITQIMFLDSEGKVLLAPKTGDNCALCFRYRTADVPIKVEFAFGLLNSAGEYCLHCSTNTIDKILILSKTEGWIICSFNKLPLVNGIYHVNYLIQTFGGDILEHRQNACEIEVSNGDFYGTGRLPHYSLGPVVIDYRYEVKENEM